MSIENYLSSWQERAKSGAQQRSAAVHRAREHLADLAKELRLLGSRRTWLVGSLARGTFTSHSDIDLLVEGMTEETAWRAAEQLSEKLGMAVEVLRTEDMGAGWRRHHETYGELLDG